MTPTDSAEVRFEGFTPGTEIWGSTQANFLIQLPRRNAKEAAILLNDPTAKFLAEALGREDTPEFREEAARVAGQLVFQDDAARGGATIDSLIMISNVFFEQRPDLLEQVKAALS